MCSLVRSGSGFNSYMGLQDKEYVERLSSKVGRSRQTVKIDLRPDSSVVEYHLGMVMTRIRFPFGAPRIKTRVDLVVNRQLEFWQIKNSKEHACVVKWYHI